jgi:hypothetical protein
MDLDPVLLSRLQFAWLIAWHILLPAFTVGLASYIAFLEGLYFVSRRDIYFRISAMWTKVFAISFGMGVVSGVVMPFQFGTNWSRFADATANVLSPLFAYEALMAFFLEASFLGILLFGRKLVPRWAHFVAAHMVAFGTLLSAFWILAANSWMQTPAGAVMENGLFYPVSWFEIIFNPILSVSLRAHCRRVLCDDGVCRGRRRGALPVAAAFCRGRPGDAVDDAVAADDPRSAADPDRRPARPQHAQASARQDRRHRRQLGDAGARAVDGVRVARCGG